MSQRNILRLIGFFLAIVIGSFVWYVASWDGDAPSPGTSFILPEKLPPEAPAPSESAAA